MAEKSLDRAKVGAVHEKVGRERMAKSVRSNVFSNSGSAGVFFYNALDGAGGEAAIISGSVGRREIMRVVKEEGRKGVGTSGEIFFDAVGGGLGNEDGTVFLAFAADDKFATLEVD